MAKRPGALEHDVSPEYDVVRKTVADRVREARAKAGLTQGELAEKIDSARSYVFEMETGTANITLKRLTRLATALGKHARDFLPESPAADLSADSLERLYSLLQLIVGTINERHQIEVGLVSELRGFLSATASAVTEGED